MKKLIRIGWAAFCILLAVLYAIASFSSFISPLRFNFIALAGLAFPYLFLLMALCCIISFFFQKKTGLLLVLTLLPGIYNLVHTVSFKSYKKWQPAKKEGSLRIMTWNVEGFINSSIQAYDGARPRIEMLHTIQQYNPDVLCVQEYRGIEGSKTLASVKKELDSIGYHFAFLSNDKVIHQGNKTETEGVAIFSKLPLVDSGRTVISSSAKVENLVYADVLHQNKRLRIFTAHLVSFYLYGDTVRSQLAGQNIYRITYHRKHFIEYRLRETEVEHAHEVALIRRQINQSPYPVIYCGDLNTTPASYNYRTLKGNLQDAFLQKGSGIGATFYKIIPTLRIDVCLADRAFKVLQCQVEKRKLSDHYPVISDLQWKP